MKVSLILLEAYFEVINEKLLYALRMGQMFCFDRKNGANVLKRLP